jgi:hypothetical protein
MKYFCCTPAFLFRQIPYKIQGEEGRGGGQWGREEAADVRIGVRVRVKG